jgi:hypothetical protein
MSVDVEQSETERIPLLRVCVIPTEVEIHENPYESKPLTLIPVFTGMTDQPIGRAGNLEIRDAL